MKTETKIPTLALIILDGWGLSDKAEHNAIAAARTPNWDRLWAGCPHRAIQGSGGYVGLPDGQMGNSEVGHLNLGAGRVVYQEYTRIARAVAEDGLAGNSVINEALELAVSQGRAVHVMGLLSPGGVHSHEEQIFALLRLAARRAVPRLYMHAFLDGRDTPPRSARPSLARLEELFAELGQGRVASICGRYYAMDRDHRWERTEQAYRLIAHGQSAHEAVDALTGLAQAYERDEDDEFVAPTRIVAEGQDPVRVETGDVVIFMNFRADRARQLTEAFTADDWSAFDREPRPVPGRFVTLTEYKKDYGLPVAFPATQLHNGLGETLSRLGLRQLRIAETEKYAHVTFFFNGGEEEPFPGEDRILVPSPKVATYDLQPEMSAPELTDRLVEAIVSGDYAAIVCNYANPDMVGHTGNFAAAVQAVECIDACLGRLVEAARSVGAELLVTADHGNIEKMADEVTGQSHTAHTSNPVPLLYIGRPAKATAEPEAGALSDIAPTMLSLMGLPIPAEMDGHPLFSLEP